MRGTLTGRIKWETLHLPPRTHLAHGLDAMTKEEMLALFQLLAQRLNVQLILDKETPLSTASIELIPNASNLAAAENNVRPAQEPTSNADTILLDLETDEARREQAAALCLVTDLPDENEEEMNEVNEDIVMRTNLPLANRFYFLQDPPLPESKPMLPHQAPRTRSHRPHTNVGVSLTRSSPRLPNTGSQMTRHQTVPKVVHDDQHTVNMDP